MNSRKVVSLLVIAAWMAVPVSALAQDGLTVTVATASACTDGTFQTSVDGSLGPFSFTWDFGDGDSLLESDLASPHETTHSYPAQGEYAWSLLVETADSLTGTASGTLTISGPEVTLTSEPFPPLLTLEDSGTAQVNFTAQVSGGTRPYSFAWDLNGDGAADEGIDPASDTASFAYDRPGEYKATVTVTDGCGLMTSDTLTVVVLDAETGCHPMAQRIADALNTLDPGRTTQPYTCQDIFNFFQGGWTGIQLGFGRMWHAYHLALVIDELTWEEILDWHLNGTGWGILAQLDRFAEVLQDVPLGDLVALVANGEATIQDVRTAVRAALRYEVDFEDALARLGEGATPGDLQQFYRSTEELGIAPEVLDAYLEEGLSLQDLRHAGHLAEQQGVTWEDVLGARLSGSGWGEIRHSYQDETGRGNNDSDPGRPEGPRLQNDEQEQRQAEHMQRLALRLAERYGIGQEQVLSLYQGTCGQDWGCVVTWLREHAPEREHGGGRP